MCGLLSLYMRLINHNVRVIIHLPFRHNSLVFWHATKILSISDRKITYASFHISTVSININFHRTSTYVICIEYFGLFYLSEEYFQWQKCHTILKKQKIEFWTNTLLTFWKYFIPATLLLSVYCTWKKLKFIVFVSQLPTHFFF